MLAVLKKLSRALAIVLICGASLLLVGCLGGKTDDGIVGPKIDNSTDLQTPTEEESAELDDTKTYYNSKYLNLVTEINGSYRIDRPFTLDENDESKRIYDNLYLYEDDLFYMTTSDNKYMWCTLSDAKDKAYVVTAYDDGEAYQIDVLKSGIYCLIFDTKSKSFDVEYKSEITTPVYETITGCEIYDVAQKWTPMTKSGDEFSIENYYVEQGKAVSFFNLVHTSHYKTTLEADVAGKYVCKTGTKAVSEVWFMIGGTYNIYLNAKTYVVRVELVSADENGYSAKIFYDENGALVKGGLELAPVADDTKYLFTCQYKATSDIGGYGVVSDDLPKIYNSANHEYALSLTEASLSYAAQSKNWYYFRKVGTYNLTIDLQNFTLTIEKLPE